MHGNYELHIYCVILLRMSFLPLNLELQLLCCVSYNVSIYIAHRINYRVVIFTNHMVNCMGFELHTYCLVGAPVAHFVICCSFHATIVNFFMQSIIKWTKENELMSTLCMQRNFS